MKRTAAPAFPASIHAVLAGVDRVPEDWLAPLSAPAVDTKRIAEAFTDPAGCAIPHEQVVCLTDRQATRSAVVAALAAAVARAGPDDCVYFYFAGHGLSDDRAFYLCSSDAEQDRLGETAISSIDIQQVLEPAECRGVLVILDCCEGAAFAEHAPAMFRKLRRGEFRILLSSVRADQRSWEKKGGGGTLFSNALIEIVEGKVSVGTTPGAAYFSDMVSAIDSRIAEVLESLPGHPNQDMVFVGTYIRDPLILVHRSLSLQQVQFATARYSPAHLRRVLTRSATVVIGLIFFSGTTGYGLLRATQYVRDEGERFVVYQGHPRYNLPGYPRELWSLPYGAERLSGVEKARGLTLVAPLGQPVYPIVEAKLRPDARLLDYLASGRSAAARELATELMNDSAAPFEQRLNAHLVFAMLALPSDVDLLRTWLEDERTEVRRAALRALMRVVPKVGFNAAEQLVDSQNSEVHVDVLRLLEGECDPAVTRYLENRFDSRGSHPTNEQIFDAAVRLQCRLGSQSLLRSVARPQLYGDVNAASYAQLVNAEAEFATLLVKRLREGSADIWRQGTILGTLSELRQAPCIPEYRAALSARMLHVRVMAMAAAARHCPGSAMRLGWDPKSRAATVELLEDSQTISSVSLATSDDQARNALVLLTRLPNLRLPTENLRDTARALLDTDRDDHLRAALVQTLARLRDKTALPAPLLDSNNLEVRSAVVEYRRSLGDPELPRQLLARIGGSDGFYVGLLGRMPLDGTALQRLSALLEGTAEERRQAACVLAMQANDAAVLRLLVHPDSRIRGEARACVAFNVNAKAIAAALPRSVDGFPIEGYRFVQEQVAIRDVLERQLAATPTSLREWRLSIVDMTPGGFGRLGRGLRSWVEEQRFQQRLSADR